MGIGLAVGLGLSALGAGMAVKNEMDKEDPDNPKTEAELSAEADKTAEKKRLARVGDRETKGKTMYSQSMPGGGIPLKDELGA